MTKSELMEILRKAKEEGQQMIDLVSEEAYTVAGSIEYNGYRGNRYYDLSPEVTDANGKPVELDIRILIEEHLMEKVLEAIPDETDILADFLNEIKNDTKDEYKETVPAE